MSKDPLGIPNCNFSLLNNYDETQSEDKRTLAKYKKQRIERGFDDTELWNLDRTIASFVLPRLKAFKETSHTLPISLKSQEWNEVLDEMIWGFNYIVNNDEITDAIAEKYGMNNISPDKYLNLPQENKNAWYKEIAEHEKRRDNAMKLFGEWLRNLWD